MLKALKKQVLLEVNELNKLKLELFCVSVKLSYGSLNLVVDNLLNELRNLLKFSFDSSMINFGIRDKICGDLKKKNIKLFGPCRQFNLVEEMEVFSIGKKLVIIIKLPVLGNLETFKVVTLKSLPVKIDGSFYKIDNLEGNTQVLVGERFRTNVELDKCRRVNRHLYCSSTSEYRLKNETETCLGVILNNSSKIWEKCRVKEVTDVEDTFIKGEKGEYFFSLVRKLTFEFLCVNNLNNDQLSLEGLGSVVLRKQCYAKVGKIMLIGSDIIEMGKSYIINPPQQISVRFEINLMKKDIIDNITKFNDNLSPNTNEWLSTYNKSNTMHYYLVYTLILVNFIVLSIAVGICCKKKIIFFEKNIYSDNGDITTPTNVLPKEIVPIIVEPQYESVELTAVNRNEGEIGEE